MNLNSRPFLLAILTLGLTFATPSLYGQINFDQSQLDLNNQGTLAGITSLMYGPDGRLYVAEYPGTIKIMTIQRNSGNDYKVTAVETLNYISDIVNHDDDGTPCSAAPNICSSRETIGITVTGTSTNPVFYVTSSDFRWGAGDGGGIGDIDLDTNSGIITRFSWNGSSWDVVDLVRGLPRSEENHATNGLEHVVINGKEYLIVASGGNTNGGSPSINFVFQCEYALSAAVLAIDLDALNSMPILTDSNGRKYIYDLPTVDDPTRSNANGIDDPNAPGYNGIDVNDPFGGNDGLNQAILEANGPVKIFSPGYRNAYDLVVTESGAVYVTDNGANGGWGGTPSGEGSGSVTNNYIVGEPGSNPGSADEVVDNVDHLELITTDIQNYVFGSFYGGHPNPIRANPAGAGLYTEDGSGGIWRTKIYDPSGNASNSTTLVSEALPYDWSTIIPTPNPVEGDWRGPTVPNPDGPDDNPVATWGTNTNGIDEYTATNFSGAMQGDLIAGTNSGLLRRAQLNPNGTVSQLTSAFGSGIGGDALAITCNGDLDVFPGTIWAGTLNGKIVVFEPAEQEECPDQTDPSFSSTADYDNDGYTNQDEIDNGSDYCNGASQPQDFDKDAGPPLVSDLNDLDDDNDGILDQDDPLQIGDPSSGGSDAFTLPLQNGLFNNQQGLGGYFGLGMTGLMNNGAPNPNWLEWLDDKDNPNDPNPNDILGGAVGVMTMQMTSGSALGNSNDQEKAFQYGIQVDQNTSPFSVRSGLTNFDGPLQIFGNNQAPNAELGIFLGDGSQSNYIKIVLTQSGISAIQEIQDIVQSQQEIDFQLDQITPPQNFIEFGFDVDPSRGEVICSYSIDSSPHVILGSFTAQGSILNALSQAGADLAIGLIGTSNASGVEVEGTWDYLNAFTDTSEAIAIYRINSGGALVLATDNGPDWVANGTNGAQAGMGYAVTSGQVYNGGLVYANRHSSIPGTMDQATYDALFAQERWDPPTGPEMEYFIPLNNGDYTVNLYLGNAWSGASTPGQRVYDILLEGVVVLSNLDLITAFSHQSGGMLSFPVNVNDGELNVSFGHQIENPLINALEVLGQQNQEVPIFVNPIADQNHLEGDSVSLQVVASGGDGQLQYSAVNLPDGLSIDLNTGEINGTIAVGSSSNSPFSVTITVDDTDANSNDQQTVSFIWTIANSSTCAWNPLTNAGIVRFEARSEVIGNKMYVIGGFTTGVDVVPEVEMYDLDTNTWFYGANMPTPVTHMGTVVVGDDIWLIGGFVGDDPGPATAVVQIYNTISDTWSTGPDLPEPRASGEAAVVGQTIHFIGGLLPDRKTEVGDHYILDLNNLAAGWGTSIPMPTPRNHHSIINIGNLIYTIGGQKGHDGITNDVKVVEAFNTVTQQWSTLADLPEERSHFESGTTLYDGKIIIVGGNRYLSSDGLPNSYFNEITQYDPATDQWTELCTLSERLLAPVAQAYNGQLFVSGGGIEGPFNLTNATQWMHLPPETNSVLWIDKNEDESYAPRHECQWVQAGDRFILLGGRESDLVQSYNYANDTWSTLSSGPEIFSHFQAVEYGGYIWVIGALEGNNWPDDVPHDFIWLVDPLNGNWIQGPAIPPSRVRGSTGVILYNDKFYIVGGSTNGHAGGFVSWFDEYDPSTDTWIPLADAPNARDHFHATLIGDKLYAVGGRQTGNLADDPQTAEGMGKPLVSAVDVYDFNTSSWSTLPLTQDLPTPRAGASVVNYNNTMVVIGGEVYQEVVDGTLMTGTLTITEQFDPTSGTWNRLANLNHSRHGQQALVSANGIHIIAGSPIYGGSVQRNMECYGDTNPQGAPLVSSQLSIPTQLNLDSFNSELVQLEVTNGNTGIYIRSMQISGVNAGDFAIVSGDLTNSLLLADSQHTMSLQYTGLDTSATANLLVNYGFDEQLSVSLNYNQLPLSIVSFTLIDTDNDTELFDVANGDEFSLATLGGANVTFRANTTPSTVGSVELSLLGPVTTSQITALEPYTLHPNSSGDYTGEMLLPGTYELQATPYSEPDIQGYEGASLTIQFTVSTQAGDNEPPIAVLNASFTSGPIPLDVSFSSSNSSDDQGIESYLWDFGNGDGSTDPNPSYTYVVEGSYLATLTVTDSTGLSDSSSLSIEALPPTITQAVVRINAAGPFVLSSDGGADWVANGNNGAQSGNGYTVNTGRVSNGNIVNTNRHSSIPATMDEATFNALFAQERWDPPAAPEMEYSIPLTNGVYTVNLYMGNSYSGASAPGQRLFDILLEGTVVLSNFDLITAFGHQSGGMLSFPITVSDGELNISLSHQVENPLINAIEVITQQNQVTPIILNSVANQNDQEGNSVALQVIAFGGEAPLQYTASNLPGGLTMNLNTGEISGSIDTGVSAGSPYTVSINVSDSGNPPQSAQGQFQWVVNPSNTNEAPTAVASASPSSGNSPLNVVFSGSNSTDDQGIDSFLWNFGDGNSSTLDNPSHTYQNEGNYTAILTVTDTQGLSDSDSVVINVGPPANQPPMAVATASPTNGDIPLMVNFNGSGSSDDNGIIQYQWVFGDGASSTNINPSHTYNSPGLYQAILTVTDAGGLSDSDTVTIDVSDQGSSVVTGFVMVNANTNSDLVTIQNGGEISESTISGIPVNIRANVSISIGSMQLVLDGPLSNTRTENVAPYALFGDNGGDYFGQPLLVGSYTMTATAYSGYGLGGTNLGSETINFSIGQLGAKQSVDIVGESVSLNPNPTIAYTNIIPDQRDTKIMSVRIFDSAGRFIKQLDKSAIFDTNSMLFSTIGLEEGIYYLTIVTSSQKIFYKSLLVDKR